MRISALLLGLFLVLASCSDGTAQRTEELQARVQALETRLAELEKRHEQEVQTLRQDMRNILQYFNIALENMEKRDSMSESLRRNWEALKQETRRLMDKMQQELEELGRQPKEHKTLSSS